MHQARVWDHLLGGALNSAVDRHAASVLERELPGTTRLARANRRFLHRLVGVLRERGIGQFLELGSGLPTAGHLHQVVAPGEVVVYVDNDPATAAQGRALVLGSADTVAVEADLRAPATIFAHPAVRRVLDPSRPVAVLMLHVLHLVEDVPELLHRYRLAVAEGSALAVSHLSPDYLAPADRARLARFAAAQRCTPRSRAEFRSALLDWRLDGAGMSTPDTWPDPPTGQPSLAFCCVARADFASELIPASG
ncbi:SAM-dependent methyltransferase [Kutzneria albida]|uniref:S-adenosyl methyltransferase n=1 Tax=Kutzneria albida DSM 43870 TaxID=1449976 RepID=W5WMA8_9PSEU|nr:SAM-dependent methyltransferase [Kutzneria albida]AHH99309.1 hypothetical protein KALB_5948 [Kutzneria albida DSM 43870]